MSDFYATKVVKGKTLKQRFNDRTWDLLGPNKNGWQRPQDQVVTETKTQKPSTGQRIENKAEGESGNEQVIEDKSKAMPEQVIDKTDSDKEEKFMKHIEGFNKATIKDFFDEEDPKVEYSNKAGLPELKKQLGQYLKFDIETLQAKFEA